MKKLIIFIPMAFLYACGPSEADKKSVCDCEAMFQHMKDREGDYLIEGNMSSAEAQKKVQEEFKDQYDKCTKLHQDIGDEGYFKITKDCASK